MEIRFYDRDMSFLGVMENQTSLIWLRKYNEPGTFELHTPVTTDNLRLTKRTNLIWIKGASSAGVIEDLSAQEDRSSGTYEITASGRFLSSYMDRRLIKGTVYFDGLVEVAMRQLLSDAAEIPLVQLGDLQEIEDTISFQATYKNLLTYEEKLAKSAGLGFRFRPDFEEKVIYFEVFEGTDRSASQATNRRVIFSESYGNLNGVNYRENDQLYKNLAYVGGEGEGSERAYTTVGDETATGLDLREVFVDAKDISSEDLTEAEYLAALSTRGQEKLNEDIISTSLDCETEANGNFRYKTDYDLGDIVTVRKTDWGISVDLRITEIQETYERGGMTVTPTFGDPIPESIDWSDT